MIDLIKAADALCLALEKEAEKQIKICFEAGVELEHLSWEVHKMSNELREIIYYKG